MQDRLIWLDLEMTGIDPRQDRIVEIATIVTDNNLTVIAQGPVFVVHQPEQVLQKMHDVVKKMHRTSGLDEQILQSTLSCEIGRASCRERV